MGKWAWLIWTIIAIFLVYSSKSLFSKDIQSKVQSYLPVQVNNIFNKLLSPASLSIIANPQTNNRLGQLPCNSDIQCRAAFSSYPSSICQSDGYCYSGV